jgi:hypothetical protein
MSNTQETRQMPKNVTERHFPAETLLAIAAGRPADSISHMRKLVREGLVEKSYEKRSAGPGRPTRKLALTEKGMRYLRIDEKALQTAESNTRSRKTANSARRFGAESQLPNVNEIVKLIRPELDRLVENRIHAMQMPSPPKRGPGRPRKNPLPEDNNQQPMPRNMPEDIESALA